MGTACANDCAPAPTRCRACPALPPGFFDGKTSAEERQRYLLETIRTSTQVGRGLCVGAALRHAKVYTVWGR